MARGRNNTLVPMCRETRNTIALNNDGLVTATQIQERLEINVEAYKATLRALDPEAALKGQRAQAIKTALLEWPAYKEGGEFIHLDPSREHPSVVWGKVVSYRKERLANAEESEQDAENSYSHALLREQIEAGIVPADATEPTKPEPEPALTA